MRLNGHMAAAMICVISAGCGGGSGGGADKPETPPSATYSVGGTVSGLMGTGLTLRNNNGNELPVTENGNFEFSAKLASGAVYSVAVGTQPTGPSQTCTINHAAGTLRNTSVTNVEIVCTTDTYTVGGAVTGLADSGLTLNLNTANPLTIDDNGSFSFPASLASGSDYSVTIAEQPTNPGQTCTIANSSGTLASANIDNVTINCTTNLHSVGGMVTGLEGSGLAISLNGTGALTIDANGSFSFPSAIESGSDYAVTISAQPTHPAQTCGAAGGVGTVHDQNIVSVRVTCVTAGGTVGGSVTGLRGTGLELRNNGGDPLIVNTSGQFTFNTPLPMGSSYNVTVATPPHLPRQICEATYGTGTVGNGAVTSVQIECALRPGNLRTSIPVPSYPQGSGELLTFLSLNTARNGGRFGQLAQDVNLDAAAHAHAQYLAAHFYSAERFDPLALSASTSLGAISAHAEQQGKSLFTGTLPADRARAAGYGWIDGAEAAVFNVGKASRDCSDQILDSLTVRHRIMDIGMRDIGVGIADTVDGKGFVCVVLAAYSDFRGEAPGGWVGVYPFDASEPISLAMASDATGEAFGTNRGMPVMLMADRDAPLSLTVTLRESATNVLINTTTVTNDTLPGELTPNQAFAIPSAYLEQNTMYTVRAVGTVEGLPVDQNIQFTTGARSHSAPFMPTLAAGAMRAVYAYPTDRQVNDEYRAAVQMAIEHMQGWYQQQLGGETFSIYSTQPQLCALPEASAYYLDDTWSKVQADIQSCVPAGFGDPDYSWIIYADVLHGCNRPGRLGAGGNTLTMLPRADLEGLVGRDTGIDDCGVQNPIAGISRFIGGLAHEVGHTLDIPHPPGCDLGLPSCDAGSVMWVSVYSYPVAYFSATERASLLLHRFINAQRFGR